MSCKCFVVAVYITIYLGLLGLALWDVTNITIDYITSNRLTNVRSMEISDRYPFLGITRINMNYREKSLFPNLGVYFPEFNEMLRNSLHGSDIQWKQPISDAGKKVAENIFRSVVPYGYISSVDSEGLNFTNTYARNLGTSQDDLFSIIDNFLTNPENLALAKNAWLGAQNMFIQKSINGSEESIILEKIYTLTNSIRFTVPLSEKMSIKGRSVWDCYLDLLFIENGTQFPNAPQSAGVTIDLPGETLLLDRGVDNGTLRADITIYNNGVYDSKAFPPCTQEFETADDCLQDIREKTISEICDCVQFSAAVKKFWNYGSAPEGKRFCTTAMYKTCWTGAYAEVQQRQKKAKSDGTCTPCTYPQNFYKVAYYSIDWSTQKIGNWFPRKWVRFQTQEQNYLYFEEQQQFTYSQFVSQIGGSLGLYIGFSMLTFVQVILFLCGLCRRPKGASKSGCCEMSAKHIMGDLDMDDASDNTQLATTVREHSKIIALINERVNRMANMEHMIRGGARGVW